MLIGPYLRITSLISYIGCSMVLCLLATLLICIHTLISVYSIFTSDTQKDGDFLVGSEDGCCGLMAIVISAFATDQPVKAKSKGAKRRAAMRVLTLGIQIPIIVITCAGLNIISKPEAYQSQKTSMFVYLVVLMLHITNMIENIYEGVTSFYDD